MDPELLSFIAVGAAAQLVDGALGMAFGTISSTFLLSMGVSPAVASASVHTVEVFTTAVSGTSHAMARNVDWRLFARLVLPGGLGAVLGAYILTAVPAETARPIVLVYLAILGAVLVARSMFRLPPSGRARAVTPLGLVGGFLDSAGGGGWGSIVTSNLLIQGASPRHTIGTVCLAEVVVTLISSVTFVIALGTEFFSKAMLGLLVGGVLVAPLGAALVRRVRPRALLAAVGVVLFATSCSGIIRSFS